MNYFLSLFAFIATVVGIYGNTWKEGEGRPTGSGLVILAVALMVLLLSIGKHYTDYRRGHQLRSIACSNSLRAIHGITSSLVAIYADAIKFNYDDNKISASDAQTIHDRIKEFIGMAVENLTTSSRLHNMLDELRVLVDYDLFLQSASLSDRSIVLSNEKVTWIQVFSQTAAKGIKDLDDTITAFGFVLESEQIYALNALRGSWLTKRFDGIKNIDPNTSLSGLLQLEGKLSKSKRTILEDFIYTAQDLIRACSTHGRA